MPSRGRRRGLRSHSRTVGRAQGQSCDSEGRERKGKRTLPQATLALSEYSEMATFSSTRWSAKLSGLRERDSVDAKERVKKQEETYP